MKQLLRWLRCPKCHQSTSASYAGKPVCLRCNSTRSLVKLTYSPRAPR